MKEIWQYTIRVARSQHIEMPEGAKLLHLQSNGGTGMLYCEVTPGNKPTTRVFSVFGTGWEMPDNPGVYVGSCEVLGHAGRLIHLYERPINPTTSTDEDDSL